MIYQKAIKLLKSFGYAWQGIVIATREQLNIKIHWLAILCVCIAGWYWHISVQEWCWIILCFGMVLCAELFNSAIEDLVNFISPGHHHLAGKIKDMAAGAVLVTAIAAALIAFLIFAKHLPFI